jgi:hypothetical protein
MPTGASNMSHEWTSRDRAQLTAKLLRASQPSIAEDGKFWTSSKFICLINFGKMAAKRRSNERESRTGGNYAVSSSSGTYCPFCAVFSVHNIFLTVLVLVRTEARSVNTSNK